MARKNEPTIIRLSVELDLTPEQITYLSDSNVEEGGTPTDRTKQVIASLVNQYTGGGLLLTGDEVKRITDATGIDPSCGEDLLPFLSEGAGREEGKLIVKALVDPSNEPPLAEIATLRGVDVQTLVSEMLQHALENNWYEALPYQPEHVLMTPDMKAKLETLLGKKFTTGTELGKLIEKALDLDNSSLFAEALAEPDPGVTA